VNVVENVRRFGQELIGPIHVSRHVTRVTAFVTRVCVCVGIVDSSIELPQTEASQGNITIRRSYASERLFINGMYLSTDTLKVTS
jgi:hypothetical protein